MRQLVTMYEGHRREMWYPAALLASIIAEIHRDRDARSRPYTEADFHPEGRAAYRDADQEVRSPTKAETEALERLFPAKD